MSEMKTDRKRKNMGSSLALNGLAFAICLLFLVPIVWMIVVSVKPEAVDTTRVSNWFVPPFTMENIRAVFSHPQANVLLWMKNSLLVSVLNTLGVLTLCVLCAFSFSRVPYKGKGIALLLVMIGMMIPREATLVPLYLLFKNLGQLNTVFSLIAPSLAASFAVIILKNFFDGLPDALFEAARIDGCGYGRQLLYVAVPLSRSAIFSLAILVFLQSWNDFLWPFISITRPELVTIPVGLPVFRSQYLTGQGITMAAGAILSLPIIVVFIFLQKYIVRGVASAGIKG